MSFALPNLTASHHILLDTITLSIVVAPTESVAD